MPDDETRKPKNRPRKPRPDGAADNAADSAASSASSSAPSSADSRPNAAYNYVPPRLDVPELPPAPEVRPEPAPKKKPAEPKAADKPAPAKPVEKPAPPQKPAPAKAPKNKAADKASRPTQEQEAQQRRGKGGKPKEPGKTPLGIAALKAIGRFLFRTAVGKAAASEPVPVGRILRIIYYARMVVRLGPALVILLILALIVGPTVYRVVVPPTPIPAVAPLFTRSVEYWAPQLTHWSEQYNVNANLIATLMQIESCGFPGAASSVGAQGLFQVMPLNFSDADQSQMTVPDINAKTGIGVIKDCLGYSKGDVGLAMACYNGGPSLIYRDPTDWPLESQHYYTWGGGIFNDAEKNASHSDTLDEWLDAGGIGLCQKAEQVLGLSTSTAPLTPLASLLPAHTSTPLLPTLALQPANTQANPSGNNPSGNRTPGALPTYSGAAQDSTGKATATPGVQIFVTP